MTEKEILSELEPNTRAFIQSANFESYTLELEKDEKYYLTFRLQNRDLETTGKEYRQYFISWGTGADFATFLRIFLETLETDSFRGGANHARGGVYVGPVLP